MSNLVVPIQLTETKAAAKILKDAFQNDRMLQWMFADDAVLYDQVAEQVFETWINLYVRYGLAWRTQNFDAIMLCDQSSESMYTLWRMFRSGVLKTPRLMGKKSMSHMRELGKMCDQSKKKITEPFWHCWMVGVKPEVQGQGYGKQLMQALFDKAKQDHMPIYLETVTGSQAEKIYSHYDFKIIDILSIPEADFQITTMLKST